MFLIVKIMQGINNIKHERENLLDDTGTIKIKRDLKDTRCEIVEYICVPLKRTECLPL
jgi:hypothetical protein